MYVVLDLEIVYNLLRVTYGSFLRTKGGNWRWILEVSFLSEDNARFRIAFISKRHEHLQCISFRLKTQNISRYQHESVHTPILEWNTEHEINRMYSIVKCQLWSDNTWTLPYQPHLTGFWKARHATLITLFIIFSVNNIPVCTCMFL